MSSFSKLDVYESDFSIRLWIIFCLIELTLNDFVPPTDLIGLKKLILHIFSNQVAAFLAFYPFYFCIFWENIFYIQEKKVCFASSFWNYVSLMVCEFILYFFFCLFLLLFSCVEYNISVMYYPKNIILLGIINVRVHSNVEYRTLVSNESLFFETKCI